MEVVTSPGGILEAPLAYLVERCEGDILRMCCVSGIAPRCSFFN